VLLVVTQMQKLQDLSFALDNGILLGKLKCSVNIANVSMSTVSATMRDKGGVEAATLAKNLVIGIEWPTELVW
jgi:hypothetical protein